MFNDIDKNDSLENWAKALSIPTQTVMYSIGLSFELSDLRNPVNKLLEVVDLCMKSSRHSNEV